MSYSFDIDGIKININKFLYWFIYIFSEKIIWLFLTIIITFITAFVTINNNSCFLFDFVVRNYVFIPLTYCMIGSIICMCPIIICFEYIPYYFHIKKYTENCRKNRAKYQEKIRDFVIGDTTMVLKRSITDLYTFYLDVTQNRKKWKECTFLFKKHLALDNLGPRNVKIISEIKSASKYSITTVSRVEELYGNNGSSVHAFESIYTIKNKQMILKRINYIGGRT